MKRVLVLLLACCLLFVGCVSVDKGGDKVTITLEVTHKDGTVKTFEVKTDAKTVAEAFEAEGLIEEGSSAGLYDVFDGEKVDFAADESWWQISCNGEVMAVGLQDVEPAEGDVYSAVYTIGFE